MMDLTGREAMCGLFPMFGDFRCINYYNTYRQRTYDVLLMLLLYLTTAKVNYYHFLFLFVSY